MFIRMRGILAGIGAIVALALPATAFSAPALQTDVFPTGNAAVDVPAVQAALDAGGTVRLKATDASGSPRAFNFGPPDESGGFVSFTADATLTGEVTGGHMTTIKGGFLTVRSRQAVSAAVTGIHFDTPGYIAVVVNTSTGIHISENRITNVQGFLIPQGTEAFGVFISGATTVIGKVFVENNVIDGFVSDWAIGIGSVFTHSARLYAVGNVILGSHTGGIVSAQSAPAAIEGNHIQPGPSTNPDSPGNGIWIAGAIHGGGETIRSNTVVCVNPKADGISISAGANPSSNEAHIVDNDVAMAGSELAAIALSGNVSNVLVNGNRLAGSGASALRIAASSSQEAHANVFTANDISQFQSTAADAFLDVGTRENYVAGDGMGTVIDLGTDNKIVGFTPI